MEKEKRAVKTRRAVGLKKEVFGVDEVSVCATVAYGFSDKREALKAMSDYTGQSIKDIRGNVRRVYIQKFKKDGEDYYFWGDSCGQCGKKNRDGVPSFIYEA